MFNVSVDYLVGLIDEPVPYERKKNVLYFPQEMDPSAQQFVKDLFRFIDASKPQQE